MQWLKKTVYVYVAIEMWIVSYTNKYVHFHMHFLNAFQTTPHLHVGEVSTTIEKYVLIKIPMYM